MDSSRPNGNILSDFLRTIYIGHVAHVVFLYYCNNSCKSYSDLSFVIIICTFLICLFVYLSSKKVVAQSSEPEAHVSSVRPQEFL